MTRRLPFIALLAWLLCACTHSPAQLKPSGEYIDVTITANRYDSVWTEMPESKYGREVTLNLGEDFLNFDDPTWWERYRNKIQVVYSDERSTVSSGDQTPEVQKSPYWVLDVPPIEWLKENVRRGLKNPFLTAKIGLPTDGTLRRVVTSESFQQYIDNYPREKSELAPMQVSISGESYNSLWEIVTFPERDHRVFVETLEELQDSQRGLLLYQFSDGNRYLLISLPHDFMELDAEALRVLDYSITLHLEVYRR